MPQFTVTVTVASGSFSNSRSQTYTSDLEKNLDVSVPANSTDFEVQLAWDKDRAQVVYIESDKNITIETNSGATPGDTLAVVADKPYLYRYDDLRGNIVTVDVTSLFITNPNPAAANVKIRVLEDATP